MSHIDGEIASQPACWRRAAELAPLVGLLLPRRGQRVAAVGCGTSWHAAHAFAALREAAGHGETDAFATSRYPFQRHYDRVVVFSRSGTTTEVLDLLKRLRGTATTTLTADPGAPVHQYSADTVLLDFADERSIVQTRFPTSALALLRAHLDVPVPHDAAREALDAPLPLDPAAIEQVAFLGDGWAFGLAREAALKCLEAAGLWAEAYPPLEYRHGPIAIAQPGRAVWALGPLPAGLERDIAPTGATLVHSGRDPLAELVVIQRFAVEVARHRGLDPDHPRGLTRAVVR